MSEDENKFLYTKKKKLARQRRRGRGRELEKTPHGRQEVANSNKLASKRLIDLQVKLIYFDNVREITLKFEHRDN